MPCQTSVVRFSLSSWPGTAWHGTVVQLNVNKTVPLALKNKGVSGDTCSRVVKQAVSYGTANGLERGCNIEDMGRGYYSSTIGGLQTEQGGFREDCTQNHSGRLPANRKAMS